MTAGASASPKRQTSGTINIGVVAPFSGPMAQIGQLFDAACVAGAYAVNHGGGVLGNTTKCAEVDNTGDPADAVPNVSRAIATLSNFDMAVGLDTATAATTIPLINKARIPLFTLNGLAAFDNTTDPYYWRLVPDDTQHGAGFALWAVQHHEKNVALVFQNSAAAEAAVPGIVSGMKHLHGKILVNETIPGDRSSYASVVAKVIRAHPQAIMTDGDAQTMATFFAEYSQLNHGQIPPIITSTDLVLPDFFSEMKKVLGAAFVPSHVYFIGFQVLNQPNAYRAYKQALSASFKPAEVRSLLAQNLSILYDAVIIGALAMDKAKSTSGPAYNNAILQVTSARPGAVQVHTYQQGVAALKAGKRIDYVGVEGQLLFDSHHNVSSAFEIFKAHPNGSLKSLGIISAAVARKSLG
jgi:ABC-type branched-subunit amino acid transport system substrate-binding protein